MSSANTASPGTAPTDPLAAFRAQLAEQAQDNPGLAMLMQLMEQRSVPRVDDDVVDVEATYSTDPSTLNESMRADLQALVQGSTQLSAELETLQQRNDALAAALGACHLCFGEDAWCAHCGGRGVPGSRRPETVAFARYVRPLLQRLQRSHAVPAAVSAAVPPRAAPVSPDSTEGLRAGAA